MSCEIPLLDKVLYLITGGIAVVIGFLGQIIFDILRERKRDKRDKK